MITNSLSGSDEISETWGFGDLEMFPIDPQIQFARVADLNQDGLNDLVISNPRKSEISLLINKTGLENGGSSGSENDQDNLNEFANKFPPDARFSKEAIMLQSQPSALCVGDLNGDSRPEIIFYDDRDYLRVLWNSEEGTWGEKSEWLLSGGLSGANTLVAQDLNNDKLSDFVLLGEGWLALFFNRGGKQFDRPQKIEIPDGVVSFNVLDFNSDGLLDLAFHIPNRKDGLLISMQSDGVFSSCKQIKCPPLSKIEWLQTDNQTGLVSVSISDHLEQVMVHTVDNRRQEDSPENSFSGGLQLIQFPEYSGIKRGVCWADLNGDQQEDCLVSDPDAGLINIYLSNQDGTWNRPKVFPSLTGVEELEVIDWGHNGQIEIFMLSKDENQIGHSKWNQKQLTMTYPDKLSGLNKPLVMTSSKGQGTKSLTVVHQSDQGWAFSVIDSSLQVLTQIFKGRLAGIPERLMEHDLDQDTMMDFILFTPYEPLICLRQLEERKFGRIDLSPPGGSWQGGWATSGDLDKDGQPDLILPFKNMIRAFKMQTQPGNHSEIISPTDWSLKVLGQINGPSTSSDLASGVIVNDSQERASLVAMFDRSEGRLHFATQNETDIWSVNGSQELPINDFLNLRVIESKHMGEALILCQGKSSAVVKSLGGSEASFHPRSTFRSEAREARLQSLITGDFNKDGLLEIFALETSEHSVECLQLGKDHSLDSLNRWSVFEKRSYRNHGAAFSEPKEAVIADFTGDGLLDFCLIVHDRVILYPQKPWHGLESDN